MRLMTFILALLLGGQTFAASPSPTILTELLMSDVGFSPSLPPRSGLIQATSSGYFILAKNLTLPNTYVLRKAPLTSSGSITTVLLQFSSINSRSAP